MPHSKDHHLHFLSEAVSRLSSSLDIQESLVDTFDFLADHFPLEAISLHQYSPDLKNLKLLFLVRSKHFHFVEIVVPLLHEDSRNVFLHDQGIGGVTILPNNMENPIGRLHSGALASLVPMQGRAYMVSALQSGKETLGHLCLMGTSPDCFTPEHEEKFNLLLTPFALTMSNLLQYKRTLEFQENLSAERDGLEKDLESLRGQHIVGERGGLKTTMETVRQLEGREVPALILGETGVGKELIADAIQSISPRKDRSFIKLNCGAIPDTLVDSELFGYEKGAFTGATTSRQGRFEQAHKGTLFLDEVGELPLQAQVRLLRVLQDGIIERIGGGKPISVDVRVIAATHRNLEEMVQEGTFREDLYYRLYVFPVYVPPLRERTLDIPELVHYFLRRACDELGLGTLPQLPHTAVERLLEYSWPGNVRELENLVKRGVTLHPRGPVPLHTLLPRDQGLFPATEEGQSHLEKTIDARIQAALAGRLPGLPLVAENAPSISRQEAGSATEIKTYNEAVLEVIRVALAKSNGKIHGPGGAAELLKLNPSTLRSKMRKLGLSASDST